MADWTCGYCGEPDIHDDNCVIVRKTPCKHPPIRMIIRQREDFISCGVCGETLSAVAIMVAIGDDYHSEVNLMEQFDRHEFSVRFFRARLPRYLTQVWLGEQLKLPSTLMLEWDTAKSVPDIAQLFALSRALHVTSDWLLGLSDEGGPS